MASGGVGDRVGALLSVVTSGAAFRDAAQALAVMFESDMDGAAGILERLLTGDMLFSTTHRLQAVALLGGGAAAAVLSPEGCSPEQPDVVRSLARDLAEETSAVWEMTPAAYLAKFERESGAAAAEPLPTREDTMDSLGIVVDEAEEEAQRLLEAAASGPLLPRDAAAAMAALQRHSGAFSVDVAAVAAHNPEVAAAAVACSGGRGVWALAEAPVSLNAVLAWAALVERAERVEPAALAAFLSRAAAHVGGLGDPVAGGRLARLYARFVGRALETAPAAVELVAFEVEALCLDHIKERECAELYGRLQAMSGSGGGGGG